MRPYLAPGFPFLELGVGFRPRISHKAPDALKGDTLSVDRCGDQKTSAKLVGDFDSRGVGAKALRLKGSWIATETQIRF